MRYLLLTGRNQQGIKLKCLIEISSVLFYGENTVDGVDKRPMTEIRLVHNGHCDTVLVYETVEQIVEWLNMPESLGGVVVNAKQAAE